jgi:hypothetical protein
MSVLGRGSQPGGRRGQPFRPRGRHGADLAILELESAKEILGEVFDATPKDVDEMIRQRIMEKRGVW